MRFAEFEAVGDADADFVGVVDLLGGEAAEDGLAEAKCHFGVGFGGRHYFFS